MTSGGADTVAANPIDAGEFGRRVRALGPFETAPEIAVAVSGGPDSLCLAILMHRWTAAIGGKTIGLIVDHGLRTNAHEEALAVQRQLTALGMSALVLRWTGEKPRQNVQAVARDARYGLLLDWCHDHGVIHLALGHHAADQAETHLLRRRAGSGADGLAGMACVSERDGTRIIRPFLHVLPERLRATLTAEGLSWVDDPSNHDAKYVRTGLRHEIRATGTVLELRAEAKRYAMTRRTTDHRIAGLLAASVKLFPTGHAKVDADLLSDMEPGDGRRCLARIVSCVGALDYPPRTNQLEALRLDIVENGAGDGRTLGGCLFLRPNPRSLLVCREPGAATEILPVYLDADATWDGRFKVRVEGITDSTGLLTICRLDDRAWGALRRRFPDGADDLAEFGGAGHLPAPARAALPVLCDLDGPCALPHLPKQSTRPKIGCSPLRISFQPHKPLAGTSFVIDGG